MPKSASFEAQMLNLLLNATGITGVADNTATSPLTNLYVSLHTASPGASGTQSTNEISYTGYARQAVTRSSGSPGWTITGNTPASASPNAAITFTVMSGGSGGTVTYFSIGAASSGAGEVFYYGTVSPNISIVNGVQPSLTTSSAITEN